jgi:AraC family transcriptional regulator
MSFMAQGSLTYSCTVGSLHLTEIVYAADLTMAMHGHQPASLSAVLSGSYAERSGLKTDRVGPRGLVFRPAGSEHAVWFGRSPTKIFRIDLPPNTLTELQEIVGKGLQDNSTHETSWRLARLHAEFGKGEAASKLTLESLAFDLLEDTFRVRPLLLARSKANEARDYIHANFLCPISLQDAAVATGTHPVYLARAFRKAYHTTVGDYVRLLRVRHASDLIVDTDMPLGEVAIECGFTDQSHLNRAFREMVGLTPATYRRTHRL